MEGGPQLSEKPKLNNMSCGVVPLFINIKF